jgi:hypothetical protein
MIPWKVLSTEVNSTKLRPISMKVFLTIKFNKAPLSINVLATLCHPIGILTMKGKFLSDIFVSEWSSGPNEISTLDHFILLPSSIHWARLISHWSFFPLCLGDDGHATPEDDVDLCHLLIVVGIHATLINSPGLMWRQCYWWWHLLSIQESLAPF